MEQILIPICKLKPHEHCLTNHVETVIAWLKDENTLLTPLLVDKKTHIILDGHHRYAALIKLGYSKAPIFLVEYEENDKIIVLSTREGITVTKQKVLHAGLSGNLMPCKTSRHFIAPGLLISPVSLMTCI
jgi:hypothetical protein